MLNTSSSIPLGSSNVSLKSNGRVIKRSDGFVMSSISFVEEILSIPKFDIEYSSMDPTQFADIQDLDISVEYKTSSNSRSLGYKATVISATVHSLSGVLIPKDKFYVRKSQTLDTNLHSAVSSLGIRKNVDDIVNSSSDTAFFQLNETDWECTERLLNISDYDKVWAVLSDRIAVFSPKVSSPTKVTLGDNFSIYFNALKNGDNLNNPKDDSNRSNFYYGRTNICVPSLSKYPRTCITSVLAKTKYKDQWANVIVKKGYPIDPGYNIGESFKFTDFSTHSEFVVTAKTTSLGQSQNVFTYTFSNYDSWNSVSSGSSKGVSSRFSKKIF